MRYLLYSHDGLGLGHTRRNLAVAAALSERQPNAAVLLATGLQTFGHLGLPKNVAVVRLPGLKKLANESYKGRELPLSLEDHLELRSGILEAVVKSFRPRVLLADKHPFGVGDELLPALKALRRTGGRAVLGLRDVLDDPETVRQEWRHQGLARRIPRYYDAAVVYGSREIYDPIQAYGFPEELAERTAFCGYVVNRVRRQFRAADSPPPASPGQPTVLATAGGGQDGHRLLECFLEAARGSGWNAVVVCGPDMLDRTRKALGLKAREAGVLFRAFLPGLHRWFESASALVSMGGYNTLVEAMAAAIPTVCVPRVTPRIEQLIRAQLFARLGLLRALTPERLTPERLRDEVNEALATPREELRKRIRATLDVRGAERAAAHLEALAEGAGELKRRQVRKAA